MSMNGTFASQKFNSALGLKSANKQETNLFNKIDVVTAQVAEVYIKLAQLSQECGSIRQQKQNVQRYLQRRSEQNRVRLMGELQIFQVQINRKIEANRLQTLKIDQRITQIKWYSHYRGVFMNYKCSWVLRPKSEMINYVYFLKKGIIYSDQRNLQLIDFTCQISLIGTKFTQNLLKNQKNRFYMYNFHMNNKTTNIFRFKVKKPKQQLLHIDKAENDKDEASEQSTKNRLGFSSQYISLARKFNIKLLPGNSLGEIKQKKQIQSLNLKSNVLRIKTQFSKTKTRYHVWQSPLNLPEGRHYNFGMIQKSGQLSSRREKQAFVKINKNTVYNDMFFRLKTEQNSDLVIQQQMVKLTIKKGDQILTNLGKHCQKLLAIKQAMQKKQLNQNDIIREIKLYVLREQGASISKLDNYFNHDKLKKQIKQLIIMQRMTLVGIVTNILSHHFNQLMQQLSRIIEVILGFWYQILNHTYSQNIFQLQIQENSPIKVIIQNLSEQKLLTKRNIKLLLQTIGQKLSIIFKYFKAFYKQIQFLSTYCHDLTINRAFYQLLTIYASFVTLYESNHKIVLDNISFFATCPSPYLAKSNPKSYTLVVDLDQTLIHCVSSGNNKQKLQTLIRPGAIEFISQLSQFYQIVIFTTALESYARQVTQQFKGIDHYLFRQHAVRVKSGFVKDLSRLGRNLNKMVIVDDTTNNFKFQKENAIKVESWKGDPNDTELQSIKQLLMKLAVSKPENVTTFLKSQKVLNIQNEAVPSKQKVETAKKTEILEITTQIK